MIYDFIMMLWHLFTEVFLYVTIAAVILWATLGMGHSKLRKPDARKFPIAWFLQYFVGSLLLFSGFVKALDPLGTAYKMKDYFVEFDAQGLPFMEALSHQALEFSVFMLVAELVLGFCLVLGIGQKKTTGLTLLMMVFFFFLTGFNYLTGFTSKPDDIGILDFGAWSAFDPDNIRITDCGCFGDFIKFTPGETFFKDILLTGISLMLFISTYKMKELVPRDKELVGKSIQNVLNIVGFAIASIGAAWFLWEFVVNGHLVLAFAMGALAIVPLKHYFKNVRGLIVLGLIGATFMFCLMNFYFNIPMVDFRPFHEGTNIVEAKAKCQENPPVVEVSYLYKSLEGKEDVRLLATDFVKPEYKHLWDATKWKIDSEGTQRKTIKEGCNSQVLYFEYPEVEMDANYNFLVTSVDIDHSDKEAFKKIGELSLAADADGILTRAMYNNIRDANGDGDNYDDLEKFRHEMQTGFDFLPSDDKLVKTIIRANPGLLLLRNGKVIKKWHHRHIPSYAEVKTLMTEPILPKPPTPQPIIEEIPVDTLGTDSLNVEPIDSSGK